MKIEYTELKKALFGTLYTETDNDCLKMSRFTKQQKMLFDKTKNYINKPKKAKASSCINFDFYTDSKKIEFDAFCAVASSQKSCFIDVWVDGDFQGHFGYNEKEDRDIHILLDLKSGKKRITVYFPCLFSTEIKSFEIDDGAYFKPVQKQRKIMFFGDSITQGYTTEFPSFTYSNIVARELDAECVNQGIGAGLFDADDLDGNFGFTPDTVFVAYGTNDWIHSNDRDLKKNATKYFKKLTDIFSDARIYTILPIYRTNIEEKKEQYHPVFDFFEVHEILKGICKDYKNITVIDGLSLIPHFENFFREDGTHPNELGHFMYGNELVKQIKDIERV